MLSEAVDVIFPDEITQSQLHEQEFLAIPCRLILNVTTLSNNWPFLTLFLAIIAKTQRVNLADEIQIRQLGLWNLAV